MESNTVLFVAPSLEIQIHDLRCRKGPAETQETGDGNNGRCCARPRNNRSHANRQYELCQEHHAAYDGHVSAETPDLRSQFRLSIHIHLELIMREKKILNDVH